MDTSFVQTGSNSVLTSHVDCASAIRSKRPRIANRLVAVAGTAQDVEFRLLRQRLPVHHVVLPSGLCCTLSLNYTPTPMAGEAGSKCSSERRLTTRSSGPAPQRCA